MQTFRRLILAFKEDDKMNRQMILIIATTRKRIGNEIAKVLLECREENSILQGIIDELKRDKDYKIIFETIDFEAEKKRILFEDEDEQRTKRLKISNLNKYQILFNPIQCKICGIRFAADDNESFSAHLADHQLRMRALENASSLSREYCSRKNDWLVSKLRLPEIVSDVSFIRSDKARDCFICRSKINLKYSDEIEEWVLVDAVGSSDKYCHRKCVE